MCTHLHQKQGCDGCVEHDKGINNLYQPTYIREWWCELLQELIQAAGEEARNMAIDTNSFHHNVPAIILNIDSGWSKCIQSHNYNDKLGVEDVLLF